MNGDTRNLAARYQDILQTETGNKVPSIVAIPAIWQKASGESTSWASVIGEISPLSSILPGAIPFVSWNAATGWNGDSASYSGITTQTINSGALDSYIQQFASDVKAYGRPVFIRPICTEVNGSWYRHCSPNASPSNYALTYADYINAFQRIVNIFNSAGATNVAWIWGLSSYPSPPSTNTADSHIASYYPGDSFVSWIGYDHYDIGTPGGASSQDPMTPSAYLDDVVSFAQAHQKPLFIAEWGVRHPNSKLTPAQDNTWIQNMFGYFAQHNQIKAVVYYDYMLAFSTTAAHTFLYNNQVNYCSMTTGCTAVGDGDCRLLSDSGAGFRATFQSAISNARYLSGN